jgi:hypothetical protein
MSLQWTPGNLHARPCKACQGKDPYEFCETCLSSGLVAQADVAPDRLWMLEAGVVCFIAAGVLAYAVFWWPK